MNLLLISIDSLRLDSVSRTGSAVHTPRFDALTRDFCFYRGLFSNSTATRPVHTSLFSGLYPFEHGIIGQSTPSMRQGVATLFSHLTQHGIETHAFSEAKDIFTGLDYARYIEPFAPQPIARALRASSAAEKRFVFLHYWGAHTPYGAEDRSALGETAQLLQQGRIDVVRQRYNRAVERIFDHQIAPLLQNLDLSQWSVIIFSDHGESWTAEEPYHGITLRNSVLHVPLYYHIPGSGNAPPPRAVITLLDLYPTMLHLLDLEVEYEGFASDLRWPDQLQPYHLAQIKPEPLPADLVGPSPIPLIKESPSGLQWALFNAEHKFSYDEGKKTGRLEQTFSEEPLKSTEFTPDFFREIYADLQQRSPWAAQSFKSPTKNESELLDQRLRDLGYLE